MNDRLLGTTYHNPIWYRNKWRIYLSNNGHPQCEYEFVHDDYDGADDANDNRCGYGKTVEECKQEIDAIEDEQ